MPNVQEPHLHLEIAHVLFMDVVGYSKLLVNEQREMMQQLNQLVRGTAQFQSSEASGKLISIPSGDGMALVFFQSVEEPMHCALEISRLIMNYPRLQLRMGVHSGPVDHIRDVNDRLSVAGAGINLAQRIGPRLLIGWFVAWIGGIAGLFLSFWWDLPSGAAIVCTFGALLVVVSTYALIRTGFRSI